MSMKTCGGCKRALVSSEFSKRRASRDGLNSRCKRCDKESAAAFKKAHPDVVKARWKKYYSVHRDELCERSRRWERANTERKRATARRARNVTRWHVQMACAMKIRARLLKLPYDISADFIMALFERQRGRCYWLDIPLVPHEMTRFPQRPSLDRLDTKKGYTKDNVVLTCMFANLGRSNVDAATFGEFINLLRSSGLTKVG